jgi:hypothetical protein
MLARDVSSAKKAALSLSVRLLPAFDQYVVAPSLHARHLLPGDFKKAIYRPQGWISPVLLVDGRMDGVWRHERKGKRLAEFLGGALELTWR